MQATGRGYPITSSPNTASSLPEEDVIAGGGFWPDVSPSEFRATMRLDGTVSSARVTAELVQGITTVQRLLMAWRVDLDTNPFDSKVPDAPLINGNTITWHLYQRAVFCFAAAQLQERYQTFDNTAEGDRRAEGDNLLIDQLRRDAHWAVADIEGRTRCTVELI